MIILFRHMTIFYTIIPESFRSHAEPLSSCGHILPLFGILIHPPTPSRHLYELPY